MTEAEARRLMQELKRRARGTTDEALEFRRVLTELGETVDDVPAPRAGRPAGYTRMQDYIRNLDDLLTPSATRLTAQQIFALQENLQAIVDITVPAVRANILGGRTVQLT